MSGRRDQHEPDQRGRTEPTLGNLDQLDAPPRDTPPRDGLPSMKVEPRNARTASLGSTTTG